MQLGIQDLDEGIAIVKTLTGVEAAFGGVHPGYGTRNAVMSLGDECYLEILALDPAQSDLKTPRTDRIRSLTGPTILTFAVRTQTIDRTISLLQGMEGMSWKRDERSRKRPDGQLLEWTNLPIESKFGPQMPFFIDWKNSPHPSKSAPPGCRLARFEVLHPEAMDLGKIYRKLEIDAPVLSAARPGFFARIESPKGEVVLAG